MGQGLIELLLPNLKLFAVISPITTWCLYTIYFQTERTLSIIHKVHPTKLTLTMSTILLSVLTYTFCQYIITKSWIFHFYFGVYWDKKTRPRCPICKSIMTNQPMAKDYDLYCFKCKDTLRLRTEGHKHILVSEAKQLIKNKFEKKPFRTFL